MGKLSFASCSCESFRGWRARFWQPNPTPHPIRELAKVADSILETLQDQAMVAGVRTQGQAARDSPAARSPPAHASSEQLLMQFVKEMMAELREIRKDVNRSRFCSCSRSGRSSRATSPRPSGWRPAYKEPEGETASITRTSGNRLDAAVHLATSRESGRPRSSRGDLPTGQPQKPHPICDREEEASAIHGRFRC